MKKLLLLFSAVLLSFISINASDFVVADFESNNLGDSLDVFDRWNTTVDFTTVNAVVENDSVNASNKVVHVKATSYDRMFQIDVVLPDGKIFADYDSLSFKMYLCNGSSLYCPMNIFFDRSKIYGDNGYPNQGPVSVWSDRIYSIKDSVLTADDSVKTSFTLAFGVSSLPTDYLLDDIVLIASEGGPTAIEDVKYDDSSVQNLDPNRLVRVYNLNGQIIRNDVKCSEATQGLQRGIYIVDRKKIYVNNRY